MLNIIKAGTVGRPVAMVLNKNIFLGELRYQQNFCGNCGLYAIRV